MKLITTVIVAAAVTLAAAAGMAGAQAPQATPPKDANVRPPQPMMDELLMELLNCDCDTECCLLIKKRIKKRMKNPKSRPMLRPGSRVEREQRHKSIWEQRGRRKHTMRKQRAQREQREYRARPRTGERWLDMAHAHKLRKARAVRRRAARELEITDEQREEIRRLQHRSDREMIGLKATLKKQELDLKHLMGDRDASESDLRGIVDSIAKARADIQFLKLKTRLDRRALLTDEQRTKLRKRK